MTIIEALGDPQLFGAMFKGASWQAWRGCVATLFGLTAELTADDHELIATCIGGRRLPATQVREAWLVCGRRAGKSFVVALLAVYLTCLRTYSLAPGERGVFMILAADRRQARVVMRYIKALLHEAPLLAQLIVRETATEVELASGITIEIHTASFRSVRGYTLVGAICDEIAYWPTDDSASPDTEVLNALRPAMATVPNALILCISSPYARKGELWKAYRDHFGKAGDVLVWKADTRTMNPTVPQAVIDRAYAADPAVAAAEYGAEFRSDLESLFAREALDACVVSARREIAPAAKTSYRAFLDFAGGSGGDSAALAIAHTEGDTHVLDMVREVRPKFSPQRVCEEFAEALHRYGVSAVTSDKWGGQFPVEQMLRLGIRVEPAARPKSDLYLALLPLVNSESVELLDDERLVTQLVGLQRRTGRGRDHVDHAPGAHDDVANAVAGVLVAGGRPTYRIRSFENLDGLSTLQQTSLASRVAGLT